LAVMLMPAPFRSEGHGSLIHRARGVL
jgi:hypothetical protein